MLEIRTFRSKSKGIRVDLYRKYRHTDTATGKGKFSYKQIGSFSLRQGYESELLELLQPDEIIHLQNWLAEVRFAEQFKAEADALPKFTIRVPQKLHDALTHLYMECKRVGLDFIPHQVMLESLLHKAKLAQHKLEKINGFNSHILENIGIITEKPASENTAPQSDTENHALFKALLNLNQSLGKTCTELEEAAKQYGKQKRIPPPQLREWAGDMPNRDPNKRIKKWAYAVAIDVLHQHGINPLTIENPEKIAEYWAIQKQTTQTLKEAKESFLKTFNVSGDMQPVVLEAITRVYQRVII